MDTVGPLAAATLEQLRGYVAFIGADGLDKNFGPAAADIESADLNRRAVRNAHGAVLQLTSAPNVRLRAVDDVVEGIRRELRRDARIAFGVRTDPEFDGSLRMMAVVTGVSSRLMPPRVMASADLGLSIVR